MKAATVKELKTELAHYSQKQLLDICVRLSTFKKENKELLTYLLFEAQEEEAYIQNVKNTVDTEFEEINKTSFYRMKKGIRKVLRNLKKYIRYSKKKETEAELLLYFCRKLKNYYPTFRRHKTLANMYSGQLNMAKKAIAKLHEDLQYDYEEELKKLPKL